MTIARKCLAFAAAICATAGVAAAADAAPPQTPAGYVRSGETETCLRTMRIDSMQIINAEQILVRMSNGETWLQQPRNCSKLRKDYAFVYSTVGGELCDTTSITLRHTTADFGFAGVCIFDKFEKLEKQTAAAN